MLFDDVLHGYRVVNDPAIRSRLATFGADKGVEILAPSIYSPLMLLTHKGVRSVSDFQGQKIRTQGGAPIRVEPLKKVGVLPVSLPLGEALPAMQNRTIDGIVAAAAPFVAFKYYADIKRAEDVWRKNGGEMVTLPPAEAKRYLDLVTPVATTLLSANPKVKDDYQALLAAATKYRQWAARLLAGPLLPEPRRRRG